MAAIETKSVAILGSMSYGPGKFDNCLTSAATGNGAFAEGFVLPISTNFTISFWIKTTTSSGLAVFLSWASGCLVGITNGKLRVAYSTTGNLTGTTSINDNVWHHIELGFDGSGSSIFIDGNLELTSAVVHLPAITNMSLFNFSNSSYYIGSMDDLALWNTKLHSSNFTPPAVKADMTDPNLICVARLDVAVTESIDSSVHIKPDNSNILYSPYTWNVVANSAITINSGAYFKVNFTGNSVTLKFDISYTFAPYPQVYVRIDGVNYSWQKFTLNTDTITPVMPADTIAQGYHLIEVFIKSVSTANFKWYALGSSVRFKGLILENNTKTVSSPQRQPLNLIGYGDSILEGGNALNSTAVDLNDRNDGTASWAAELNKLGCEVGIVGFSAVGINRDGGAGVPRVTSSYDKLYYNVTRSFSTPFDICVINLATNDISDITTNFTNFLNALMQANPNGAPIFVLRPFNGNRASELQAACISCTDPSRVYYIDTTGWIGAGMLTDGLHPAAWANVSLIAPKVMQAIRPYLLAKKRGFTKMY
jgi:hypothetical protein